MNRWKWRHSFTGERMTEVRVSHFLTVDDIAGLLCAHAELETGTSLSGKALLLAVRRQLRAASVLEPVDTWADDYASDEAKARREWAGAQAQRYYEKTSR